MIKYNYLRIMCFNFLIPSSKCKILRKSKSNILTDIFSWMLSLSRCKLHTYRDVDETYRYTHRVDTNENPSHEYILKGYVKYDALTK